MAYRQADHERWQQLDFVIGQEVKLSDNHPADDICNTLAGKYPKNFNFCGWHPQCFCYVVPITLSTEESLKIANEIANGRDYEPLLNDLKQGKEIDTYPKGFTKWVEKNQGKIASTKSLPYFVKYNKEAAKEVVNPTSAIGGRGSVDYMAAEPIKINSVSIDLQGEEVTDEQVKNVIMNFAEVNPSLFKGGLADVRIMKGESSGFMATERNKDGNIIHIQNSDIELKGGKGETFNPYQELKGAFAAIANDTPFMFKQEYSLECLWHEIRHAGAVGWKDANNKTSVNTASMEVINQFCARKSYAQFVKGLGGKATHKKSIMNDGFGYTDEVKNFCTLLKKIGVGQGVAYKHFYKMIMTTNYEEIHDRLVEFIKTRGKYTTEIANSIVYWLSYNPSIFEESLKLRFYRI